jgi:methanogenic corrinoid protein MtbC1
VLRAWERRYRVVSPIRSQGGQRLYSDLDVERLRLLHHLTARGHSIGSLAGVSPDDLQRMAREEARAARPWVAEPAPAGRTEEFKSAALLAARRLDAGALQAVLERAAVTLGVPEFLDRVAAPAIHEIGREWSEGTMTVGHEHLATAVFHRVLGWIVETYDVDEVTARIIVATPPRQVHELGALLVGAAAAAEGWDVTYLGADLPVADIVGSARQVGTDAVALSAVFPVDDPALLDDLVLIRRGLPSDVALILGGAAAVRSRDLLGAVGALVVDSLPEFRVTLRRLAEQV